MIPIFEQLLRTSRESANPFKSYAIKFLASPVKLKKVITNFCLDKNYRQRVFMEFVYYYKRHQRSNYTSMNRYPEIFAACQDYFSDAKDLKILSYGCSTGEEVLTLRNYFPDASIIGADINPEALARCRTLEVDHKISFIYSTDKNFQKLGPFDAIFCMAVFQRDPHKTIRENISSLKKIYPFSKFERKVVELDRHLKSGGLFVIHFAQYLFDQTIVASRYAALAEGKWEDDCSPKFDRYSSRIKTPVSTRSIFVKK